LADLPDHDQQRSNHHAPAVELEAPSAAVLADLPDHDQQRSNHHAPAVEPEAPSAVVCS